MVRYRRILLALAVSGWLGAIVSELRALWAVDEASTSAWLLRRNQCLLLSSVCMNTLVLATVARFVRSASRT